MFDISDRVVQVIAIVGITVLGSVALLVRGDLSQTVIVAVSAFLGGLVRHYWPASPVEASAPDELS
jgi:uncharacterized membrane protein YjjP (DUF1212 family)